MYLYGWMAVRLANIAFAFNYSADVVINRNVSFLCFLPASLFKSNGTKNVYLPINQRIRIRPNIFHVGSSAPDISWTKTRCNYNTCVLPANPREGHIKCRLVEAGMVGILVYMYSAKRRTGHNKSCCSAPPNGLLSIDQCSLRPTLWGNKSNYTYYTHSGAVVVLHNSFFIIDKARPSTTNQCCMHGTRKDSSGWLHLLWQCWLQHTEIMCASIHSPCTSIHCTIHMWGRK